jgi:sortase (surface protein transpeptidase)
VKKTARGGRLLPVLIALILATVGFGMVLLAIPSTPDAPLPTAPVVAPRGQVPSGPETAVIAGAEFTAADMAPGHLFIPAIGAYAPISDRGVRAGELSIPADAGKLARWGGSAALGADTGNTLIAGHVTNGSQRGALFSLAELEAGNLAYVTDETGGVHRFQLQSLTAVVKAALPDEVWDASGARRLTVVTCGGPVTETSRGLQYRDNVIAVFVEEPAAAGV